MTEYILSKGQNEQIPRDKSEMEDKPWFNMWPKRFYPYKNFKIGDILYWLDNKKKHFVWKTEVIEIIRKRYSDKTEIKKKYGSMTEKYFNSRTDSGYFLYYKIKVISEFDKPKPNQREFGIKENILRGDINI